MTLALVNIWDRERRNVSNLVVTLELHEEIGYLTLSSGGGHLGAEEALHLSSAASNHLRQSSPKSINSSK